ncbi:MAG TPA: GNAT family N-acetyltransferase [Nitrososphaerales archaeon]|nr:GNAT family N-acetyltransferase [Nitrososphaerales archaeon]
MVRIREFSMKDYDLVRKVWEDSGLEIRPGDSKPDVRRKLTRDRGLFLVAEDQGVIVGTTMGAWDGRRGWIYHLGVLPEYRRRGVASRLVREVERRMKDMGVLKVNAIVYDDNTPSLTLFRKMGFIPDRKSVLHGKLLGPPLAEV